MSDGNVRGESTYERDISIKLLWVFGLGSFIAMLYYQYLWSRFSLSNLAVTPFWGWCWTTLAIASPWCFCFACRGKLRQAVKDGKVDRDVCLEVSVWLELATLVAYVMLAPAIHHLTTTGALK